MKARTYYYLKGTFISLVFLFISFEAICQADDYPPPSGISFENYRLTIYPPIPWGDTTIRLFNYDIDVNTTFTGSIWIDNSTDTMVYTFDESQLPEGEVTFCVNAWYHQGTTNHISEDICLTTEVFPWQNLIFREKWDSLDFVSNGWTVDGSNWEIADNTGLSAPAAAFSGQPEVSTYSQTLTSLTFMNDTLVSGDIYLEFDLKLSNNINTGEEKFDVELWDGSQGTWVILYPFSNINGNFDWKHLKFNISPYTLGNEFNIRFIAHGQNSADISAWYIDNITLYRMCLYPSNVTRNYNGGSTWKVTYNFNNPDSILTWSDGVPNDAIGTGDTATFDVAARWEPFQMVPYENRILKSITFYPNESNAQYRLRVWKGTDASELILDSLVNDLQIGEINRIELEEPLIVDASQELWIGYQVTAYSGYPAGVDQGPAMDGYGNMINMGGWQTLLQINPALDYNWLIKACFDTSYDHLEYVNIYKRTYEDECYYFYDTTYNLSSFVDYDSHEYDCYGLSGVYVYGQDTCESLIGASDCSFIVEVNDMPGTQTGMIKIYPNPGSDFILMESKIPVKEVRMFNSYGIQEYRSGRFEGKQKIDLSGLSSGIYLLRIETEKGIESRKVIVTK